VSLKSCMSSRELAEGNYCVRQPTQQCRYEVTTRCSRDDHWSERLAPPAGGPAQPIADGTQEN